MGKGAPSKSLVPFQVLWKIEMFKNWSQDFAGGPVVKKPPYNCREHRFDPWSGNRALVVHHN